MRAFSLLTLVIVISAFDLFRPVLNAQIAVLWPVSSGGSALSLNGVWKFKYVAGALAANDSSFYRKDFAEIENWASIPVPSHWEMQGFAQPEYASVTAGFGLYRRTIHVPPEWKGQRHFLRFDGVLYGFDLWINGTKIGSWASSYNPVTFDVTEALRPGEDNVVAVEVTTRSLGWEFDTNDCWALSGIYREVTLFTVPPHHIEDLLARTTLNSDGSATLSIDVQTSSSAYIKGRLSSPLGEPAGKFQFSIAASKRGAATVRIDHPRRWTAETPELYTLTLEMEEGGRTLQRIERKIGLREITTIGGLLKLNGTPIKLRGADHHDIWPDAGRVATEEHIRGDLALMKAAHINFIRTSHYPPHPRMIELCDELGFYVMCEVPIGFGDDHDNDPAYRETMLTRARATVARDKNHASVIVWSVGNENAVTPLLLETGREVKRLDPTRPICYPAVGSYFEKNYEKYPAFVDLYAPHYPVIKTLTAYAHKLTRPIIVTEYAHALGLASDRIQDEWEVMQNNPRFAGGAVWMFQDQGILRQSPKPLEEMPANPHVWLDNRHYFDTHGLDGMDGIVYSNRIPQPDYWEVAKVYCPVQIAERSLPVSASAGPLTLHIQNRYDFRGLAGMRLSWEIRHNRSVLHRGEQMLKAAAKESEIVTLELPANTVRPDAITTLALRILDQSGTTLDERVLPIENAPQGDRSKALQASLPTGSSSLKVEKTKTVTRVLHPSFSVQLDESTGEISLRNLAGDLLATGPFPHMGRRLTEAEALRGKKVSIWTGATLRSPSNLETDVSETAEGVSLRVRGKYARPDQPSQTLHGEFTLLVKTNGTIEVSYKYSFVHAEGEILEAGLAFVAPEPASEFRWIGDGPYAGYPGKDRLNEYGAYHLSRDDIRFSGNRRRVDVALISRSSGEGVVLSSMPMDLSVETTAEGIVIAQNVLLSGRGNKGGGPETSVKAKDGDHFAGQFMVLPVGPRWPKLLADWFGEASESVEVQKPFYRSYDR